jgi:competence protein ComEA
MTGDLSAHDGEPAVDSDPQPSEASHRPDKPDLAALGSFPGRQATLADRFSDAVEALEDARDRPMVVITALTVAVVLVVGAWWYGRDPEVRPVEQMIPSVRLETTEAEVPLPSLVVVHVAGAVRSPGVYALDDTARVIDALAAAGGAAPDADVDQLNLAALVVDGLQIRVPVIGEVLAAPVGGVASGPVDLNRASAAELETLPGVGPSIAAAIVAFRDESGPFLTVDDLLEVPGIGPAKLAGLVDEVVVR